NQQADLLDPLFAFRQFGHRGHVNADTPSCRAEDRGRGRDQIQRVTSATLLRGGATGCSSAYPPATKATSCQAVGTERIPRKSSNASKGPVSPEAPRPTSCAMRSRFCMAREVLTRPECCSIQAMLC